MFRKKFLAVMAAVLMAVGMLPLSVFAQENGSSPPTPTGSEGDFFANGTSITITATQPANGEQVTLDGFTGTGTSAYISWEQEGQIKYVGVSGQITVYGGGDGTQNPVTLPSTSITMTGGTIYMLYGGNMGATADSSVGPSTITGDVDITISNSRIGHSIYGGGLNKTCVNGCVNMRLESVTVGAYAMGGVSYEGNADDWDIPNNNLTTDAVVNQVKIHMSKSWAQAVAATGKGEVRVKYAEITLIDTTIDLEALLNGTNGITDYCVMTVEGNSYIEQIEAVNRGFLGTGIVNLKGGTVTTLLTAATNNCFGSYDNSNAASAVTGTMTWNISSDVKIEKAELSPSVKKIMENGVAAYTADFGGITINKEGEPLEVAVSPHVVNSNGPSLSEFSVAAGRSLVLNNVTLTQNPDTTIDNNGTVQLGSGSSMTVEGTFDNIEGRLVVAPGGTVAGTIAGNQPIYQTYTPVTPPTSSVDSNWQQDPTGWWYKNPDGSYPANQWKYLDTGKGYKAWYWFNQNGYITFGWQYIYGKWYYLNRSGEMQTGWQFVNNQWYYLDQSGAMATGWVQDGDTWYYMDRDGSMHFGWLSWAGYWYHLDSHGAMSTGWQYLGGEWYYLYPDTGRMAANGYTPDGYLVDQNGAWIQ